MARSTYGAGGDARAVSECRAAYRVDYEAELVRNIRLAGIPMPVIQYRFHPVRRWRFDLAWPDHLLAVEVDGGIWNRGRHVRGEGYRRDCIKLNEAVIMGWRVLRVTPDMIQDGSAVEYVEYALMGRIDKPKPQD